MLIGNLSVFINCDLEKCNCGSVFSHVCDRMGFFSPTLFFSNPIPVCLVKQSKSEPVSMMILRKLVNVNGEKSSCYVFLGKKNTKDCPCQQVLGPEETNPTDPCRKLGRTG